jgi:hypothetical protein
MALPVNFSEKAKQPANPAAGGYPYSIKADDLDKNFEWCYIREFDESGNPFFNVEKLEDGSRRVNVDTNGFSGSLTFKDCDGKILFVMGFLKGITIYILDSSGDQVESLSINAQISSGN